MTDRAAAQVAADFFRGKRFVFGGGEAEYIHLVNTMGGQIYESEGRELQGVFRREKN